MKNYLQIDIILKPNKLTTIQILSRFLNHFLKLYSCHSVQTLKDDHISVIIIFDLPNSILENFQEIMNLIDSYIQILSISPQTGEFLKNKTEIKENTNDKKSEIYSPIQKFMILKFQTDLSYQFKAFYSYLDNLLPIMGMGGYIEEIEDGFLIFFEKEDDYEMFFFDMKSKDAVSRLIKEKNIVLNDQLQVPLPIVKEKSPNLRENSKS